MPRSVTRTLPCHIAESQFSRPKTKMENAVLELLEPAEFLEQENAKWLDGPSSSDGGPHVDEDVNAACQADSAASRSSGRGALV